ncbi:Aste57867_19193 [Aphanomyces stellatus]|uniref:Aste57867_19193 protein n=1 Tax=Aphanomyces stellatus TaxID=120398 RepID=A0A485LC70_9STRA|nr:hypothetical protein As57867_019129 [Aphanomyces stellatus]VFT95915.1 Aste57867_19193 [Aphanomyces stellatus]
MKDETRETIMQDFHQLQTLAKQVLAATDSIRTQTGNMLNHANKTVKRALAHIDETTAQKSAAPPPSATLVGFVEWIDAKFQTKNVAGLRQLAEAYASQDVARANDFLAALENVTVFSATISDQMFPQGDVDTTNEKSNAAPPTVMTRPHTKSSSKKGKTAPPAVPTPPAPAAKSKRTADTIVPETPPRPAKKTKAKEVLKPLLPPKMLLPPSPQSKKKTIDDGDDEPDEPTAAPESPKATRRTSERGAAMTANFLRRERDANLRGLNNVVGDDQEERDLEKAISKSKKLAKKKDDAKANDDHTLPASLQTSDDLSIELDFIATTNPWREWCEHFQSFLPNDSKKRQGFNVDLKAFFDKHGQALWEQFFHLASGLAARSRLAAAQSAFLKLAYRLSEMEGDDVFKFILRTPHPAWPTFLSSPISLKSMPAADAIQYLKTQATRRWPHGPMPYTYEPLWILDLWAKADEAYMKKHKVPPTWASSLVARLNKDTTYDFDACPYVGVTVYGEDPPTHLQDGDAGPASPLVWDWNLKMMVTRVASM